MCKKTFGVLLFGVVTFFCSCVDDTYDLANKEVSMDVKIEGNKLALSLGSLRPIVLDSILDLESIPILDTDTASRSYSLSLDSSLMTRVAQKDLDVLKKVSELSAEIDPISIPIDEIKFSLPTIERNDTMSFAEVELTDVEVDAVNENVELPIDELTLDPIDVEGEDHPVDFEIPNVVLEPVTVPYTAEDINFSVDSIKVENVTSEKVENNLDINIDEIDLNNITTPTFETEASKMVGEDDSVIKGFLSQGDDYSIETTFTASFDNTFTAEDEVNVKFVYSLPKEIKHFNSVKMKGEGGTAGALFEFRVVNPTLLNNVDCKVSFHIEFPENYELALCDDENKKYYKLNKTENNTTLDVTDMPATGVTTLIHFYLKELEHLDVDSYYEFNENGGKSLSFNDKIDYKIDYKVNGSVTIPTGTTVRELKEGLSYSISLDGKFDVDEAYGTTNPVEVDLENKDLDFSFLLEDLQYIKRIGIIDLNPDKSQLRFKIQADRGFGEFDFDSESNILLSFPEDFVFVDNVTLPDGVKRIAHTNNFEITSVDVFFSNTDWILPIKAVKVNRDVTPESTLNLEAVATLKALSDKQEGVFTIGEKEGLALKASTKDLCGNHKIEFAVMPIELVVEDVTAQISSIDVPFDDETINFAFPVEGEFDYIQKVNYVEFDVEKPLIITSSLANNRDFGNINFEDGSCIALRFPDNFVFDDAHSTLAYNQELKAFVINDLSDLNAGRWTLALKRVNVDQEIKDNKFEVNASIIVEAVNPNGEDNVFYMNAGSENVTLREMEKQFGGYQITFALQESPIDIADLQANTNDIDIEFKSQEVVQKINLDKLSYVTHIGDITLKKGSDKLKFRTGLEGGGLERFSLAKNSVIDFIFPKEFKLDKGNSKIPEGAEFVDSSHIQINSLKALNEQFEWELAVKRITVDKDIENEQFSEDYTIKVEAKNANGKTDSLSIAAIENLTLKEIKDAGGQRQMQVSVLSTTIEIDDAQASIADIEFDFEKQSFDFDIDIKDLEMVDEIKYVSFEEEHNQINLNISVEGELEPFDLSANSGVKISFPREFKLNRDKSKFSGLTFDEDNNALYVNKIEDIRDCNILLVLDSIVINKKIENQQFKWSGEITVVAIDKSTGEECEKLFIGGVNNLHLSQVKDVMYDKMVKFSVPKTQLRIKEAIILSSMVTHDINEEIEIAIDETFAEPIQRVDSIGFVSSVPMILKVSTSGLENVDAPVTVKADISLPPVFDITSNDADVKVTDKGLSIDMVHNFKESSSIELNLWVNSLDFTSLEEGYLALSKTEQGDYRLKYDGKATVNGSVGINNAQLSSELLDNDILFGIAFEMGEVVLKNFTGIYGGGIDPVTESFELGVDDGFAELEKNGLMLANTKPELMISLYNTIGVPVDVDLSIIGRDKKGDVIPSAVIKPGKTLRIKPAQFDAQGNLVADTTRWIFTSNETVQVPGYEVVVVKNLDSLLNELPYKIDFALNPQIVTKDVVHHVDLSKDLELGGKYSISVPFDLQFNQSIDLDLGDVADILNDEANIVTLANPQLALSIHNPIAQDLMFDLSLIGKDVHGSPISSASLVFDEPFVLDAGHRNDDGTISPTPTRWLFAVADSIKKEGYETKVAPALATLLNELPSKIDIALNAHFNTDLTTQIDYNNDLELLCEYGVMVPLQFSELHFNYADTVPEIKLNLEETLTGLNLSVNNIDLAVSMNLKNTLPVGLTVNLTPLDVNGNVIENIEIGSIELPAGDGTDIGTGDGVEGTPVELTVKCSSSSDLSVLDGIAFSLEVANGNGDQRLSGAQGLQISDIVLQIMCDIEVDLNK